MTGRIPAGEATRPSCLVVGAGIAGLTAGQRLQAAGVQVTLLDKGRGVGGRMATRRFADAVFDHGAQFFTIRHAEFRAQVDAWLAEGSVVEWTRGFNKEDGHPRYRGREGMTSPAKSLAASLDVQLEQHVTKVTSFDWRWHVFTRQGAHYQADALVLTLPIPQALALLDHSPVPVPRPERSALEAIRYEPTIAVLARLDTPPNLPAPGVVRQPGNGIAWLADNQQKGISPVPAVTIHATHGFSRAHFEDDRTAVAEQLLAAAGRWLPRETVVAVDTQFWRYSEPVVLHPERQLVVRAPLLLGFAGDAFGEARVEGAMLSGMAVANALLGRLRDGRFRRPTGTPG